MTTERAGGGVAQRMRARAPDLVWLTLVWVLLWGSFSALTVLGGLVVAVTVTAAFRLPVAAARLPVRPLRLLGLVAYLLYDLVVSSVEVSWQTLRYGPRARGAIVAVPLLTSSDRVVTLVADAFTLSPGTTVLQIDQLSGVWYVYALGPRDRAGVERARRRAMDMQRRVLAALGSPEELAEAEHLLAPGRGERAVTTVFAVVLVLLCAAGALTIVRLLRGPDTLDRIVALDAFIVLMVAAVAVYVAAYADGSNIPLLAAVALIGFVGSATAARLAERRERHR